MRASLSQQLFRRPIAAWSQLSGHHGERSLTNFLVLVAALVVFRSIILDWNQVPTGSMYPTIQIGDHIVVDKLAYDLRLPFTHRSLWRRADPNPGDIIVFASPIDDSLYVKRVIGKPGDLVALIDDILIVNGETAHFSAVEGKLGIQGIEETLLGHSHRIALEGKAVSASNFGPLRVPPDAWFVMGDNRLHSFDSRYFGFVDRHRILGQATSVAFSLDYEHGFKPRPDRIFKILK